MTKKYQVLGDVLLPNDTIPESFFIPPEEFSKWAYVKGAKTIHRISKKTGKSYTYKEGKIPFPDHKEMPSRTMLTREGGKHIAREKHVVLQNEQCRRLHPVELERLNGFPDDFTKCKGVTDCQRAFFMGNALVIGVVEKLSQ